MVAADRIDMLNVHCLTDIDFTSLAVLAAAISSTVYQILAWFISTETIFTNLCHAEVLRSIPPN
jgi:hypothetical protein